MPPRAKQRLGGNVDNVQSLSNVHFVPLRLRADERVVGARAHNTAAATKIVNLSSRLTFNIATANSASIIANNAAIQLIDESLLTPKPVTSPAFAES